jgi:hypothetical protein
MKTDSGKIQPVPPEDLPDYLGLGVLDSGSVVSNPGQISAEYRVQGDALYQVSVTDTGSQIIEFLDGEVIATTSGYRTLRETFFHHLCAQPPRQSKRLERLFRQVAGMGNILVQFQHQPPFLYFPAGYLVGLRQPIVESNQAAYSRLAEQWAAHPDRADLKLDPFKEGSLLRFLPSGEVTAERIGLADFICPLLHLADSAAFLCASGLVPPGKEFRLMVMDVLDLVPGKISVHPGKPGCTAVTFSPLVLQDPDLPLEKAITLFRAASFQYLDDLQGKDRRLSRVQ